LPNIGSAVALGLPRLYTVANVQLVHGERHVQSDPAIDDLYEEERWIAERSRDTEPCGCACPQEQRSA
jgi:hypothetical protein